LLVPGAISWAEAVDHDVAAFSTYDADLRAHLHLDPPVGRGLAPRRVLALPSSDADRSRARIVLRNGPPLE
jgi:hypothetical protein